MDVLARKAYPSDLTDAEWAHIEPLIPPGKPGGGKPGGGGKPFAGKPKFKPKGKPGGPSKD